MIVPCVPIPHQSQRSDDASVLILRFLYHRDGQPLNSGLGRGSWETMASAPFHNTGWSLLKQSDNQTKVN